jgi:hypothetical protein
VATQLIGMNAFELRYFSAFPRRDFASATEGRVANLAGAKKMTGPANAY